MSSCVEPESSELPPGFAHFCVARSKGHALDIYIQDLAGKRYWRVAVKSRDKVTYASAYDTDGVMRASATVADPAGHLLFRCDVVAGKPKASQGFQCKFGAAPGA